MSTPALAIAQSAAPASGLGVEASTMVLRASLVAYAGVERTGMSVERLAEMRLYGYWTEAKADGLVFFKSEFARDPAGLAVYDPVADRWRSYPMSLLGVAGGWCSPGSCDVADGIEGLAVGGGKVWMGTNGAGIMALDLRDRTWSRHDVRARPSTGRHSIVLHADDDYVFADVVGPGLHVFSLRRNAWLWLRGAPAGNVVEFGWTDYAFVSIRCDTRWLKGHAEIPFEGCTSPGYVRPSSDQRGYELGREFNEPGAPFRAVVLKEELARAFASLPSAGQSR